MKNEQQPLSRPILRDVAAYVPAQVAGAVTVAGPADAMSGEPLTLPAVLTPPFGGARTGPVP